MNIYQILLAKSKARPPNEVLLLPSLGTFGQKKILVRSLLGKKNFHLTTSGRSKNSTNVKISKNRNFTKATIGELFIICNYYTVTSFIYLLWDDFLGDMVYATDVEWARGDNN